MKDMGINQWENVYKDLWHSLNMGEKAVIITKLGSGKSKKSFLTEQSLFSGEQHTPHSPLNSEDTLINQAREALATGKLQFFKSPDGMEGVLIEPTFPEPQLFVLGGGHVAVPLVEFAAKTGFRVTVVDDRPSFANVGRFPLAETVLCESFDNCFGLLSLNKSSFVVIVTRGHRHDLLCLKETLKYDTAYTGMIGSKRRTRIAFKQLLEEGYTPEQIERVSAPIGVDIGAVTPQEIGISILAQLIEVRRKGKASSHQLSTKFNWPEYDAMVIEELSKDIKRPKAVVTILSTKGSVPRKAGAKMIVFSDGSILGSIGGGCSEGEVIIRALDIIKSGGYQIHPVDMTGDAAEEEGMVCGGVMEVLIESI